MSAGAAFGYKCPKGHCRAAVMATAGAGVPTCPECGDAMVPDPEAAGVGANVYCPKCKAVFGLVTSERCPKCGGEFEPVPGP